MNVIVCALLVAGAAAGLVAYESAVRYAVPHRREASVSEHVSRVQVRSSRVAEAVGSFAAVLERFAPLSHVDADACRDRLIRAGMAMEPETWRCARALATVGCAFAAGAVALAAGSAPWVLASGVAAGAAAGWLLPNAVLSNKERSRRRAIEARLPDAMELLGIAIAAGSPVEQCFREVAASMTGPIAQELATVDREVNLLGHSREEALDHLGQRCGSQEVRAFVAQMTQAVSQGSSISEGLALQATLARETAQAEAMERIRKMPTKLDIVLSLCFLPPTVALVVVPTVVNLLDFLNNSMG